MSAFFPAPEPEEKPGGRAHVCRSTGDTRLSIGSQHTYRLLGGSVFDRALEPLLVTISPGDEADPRDDYAHDGEEFAYVLTGTMAFTVEGDEHRLEAGDSIHFQSARRHAARNVGTEQAEVLWVLTPRLF
jgi:quercetin dioxygenase-like cupin family protein